MLRKMLIIAVVFAAFVGGVSGCAEDGMWTVDGADVEVLGAMLSTGESFVGILVGTWEGVGDSAGTRLVFNSDGTYGFYGRRGADWSYQYGGRFWLEFRVSNTGLYRAELHMDMPDMDDYVVRYHMADGVLYLEEPTDTESSSRYVRVMS